MSETDRRDRDDLAEFIADYAINGSGNENVWSRGMADRLIAAGWVHWPHDCKREAEQNEKWQRSEGYDEGYAVGYRAGRNDRTEPET